jgi:hypothetical protein
MSDKVFSDSSLFDGLIGMPVSPKKHVRFEELPEGTAAVVMRHKGVVYALGFHISDKVEENIKMLDQLRRCAEWTIMDKVHHDRVFTGNVPDPYTQWPSSG